MSGGKELRLLITDNLDWRDEYNHLILLQSKINSYVHFIESKQYIDIYPRYEFERFCIEIHSKCESSENAIKFIETANAQLQEHCITVLAVQG